MAHGGFSLVYLAQGPQGACVVKELFDEERCTRNVRSGMLETRTGQASLHERQLQRCREEWERFRNFRHPHIVQMLDFFEENNTGYLVMPFVEGESLLKRITRQPLSLGELLELLAPLADALDCLHRMTIIHRDVKPDNIWLRASDGKPLLLDTGAARSLEVSRRGGTGLITMLGAPELRGPAEAGRYGKVGPATDVFALAGICAFALTGHEPPEATLRDLQAASDGDPLVRWSMPVSEAVAVVVRTGLALNVEQRLQSPGAFNAAMLEAHRRGVTPARTGPARPAGGSPIQPALTGPAKVNSAVADLALAAGSNLCAVLLVMLLLPEIALLAVAAFLTVQMATILLCVSRRRRAGLAVSAIDTVPLINLVYAFGLPP